jgi:DNA repair photolyase
MATAEPQLRWELEDAPRPQGSLFGDLVERQVGRGEYRGMEFSLVRARSIINKVDVPWLAFAHSINVYRGCSHACVYCFARPTHEYLGLDIGADFDSRIVVKVNAAEVLRAELSPRRWAGEAIAMGTNTDPYQRCEGKFRLTRQVIEVLTELANPFSILTKSTLAIRDVALIAEAAERAEVRVDFSVGTLDEDVWRLTEPGTPHPRRRLWAVQQFLEAGVDCGVLMAPVLPGLSDAPEQLARVADACKAIGVRPAGPVPLHLRPGVKEHVLAWVDEHRPDLAEQYRRSYRTAYLPAPQRKELAARFRVVLGDDALPKAPVRSLYSKGARPTASAPVTVAPTRQLDFGV